MKCLCVSTQPSVWNVEGAGVSPSLLYRINKCVQCACMVEGVLSTLLYLTVYPIGLYMGGGRCAIHLYINGGRCVSCSAVLYNSWVCAFCKCACKAQGLTRTLQYVYSIFTYMEVERCANNSAIPYFGWKVKGCPLISSYSAVPHLHRNWKGCPLLCNTASGRKVEGGVSLALQYRLWVDGGRDAPYSAMPSMDGRWKVRPLLCNAVSWMGGGRVSPFLQCHFWIEGGRCAPYSAIPSLNGRWKVCPPLLCNTASKWKVESVSTFLQYRLWMEGGRCVNNNNSAIPFWMERRRCFICSAIPFSGWKLEGGMPPYSAVLSLHRSWKGCPLICNTYRLWIEG
jgi:hypothetical protein